MYYLNCFIIYSILGFILESVVYKVSNSPVHSGVLFGPYTLVYGLGGMAISYINSLLYKLSMNSFLRIILLFILFTIICTLIEYVIGNLIHNLFNIDKWNYINHKYHFGKYICLDLALTWGLLATIFMKYFKTFIDKIINIIPYNSTIIITIIILLDLLYTIYTKCYKH